MKKFILEHWRAPGDIVAMTGLVRDLKRLMGSDVAIDVRVSHPDIFENNPHLTKLSATDPDVTSLRLCYRSGIADAGRGDYKHFMTQFHLNFEKLSGIKVPVTESKPDLHLSAKEIANPPISGRYWVVMAGGKPDVTIKHWRYDWYQTVVDSLANQGIWSVQSGGKSKRHTHPPMRNVINAVGWGTLREFLTQIYHAEGVICPITAAMHVAASFDKPAVVIAGGREEPWWEEYSNRWQAFGSTASPVKVPHRYLHTIGQLDCCATKGCWKMKVVPKDGDTRLCYKPVISGTRQPLPMCMQMITPQHVIDAVNSYYLDGTLQPI